MEEAAAPAPGVATMAATLFCVVACALALYLYHALWLAPERLRAALRSQGIRGPRPSFPYGNRAHITQAAAAAANDKAKAAGIVHDYRPAVFPHYHKWSKEYGPMFSYSIGNMVFLHASRADVVRDLTLCVSLDLGKSSYMKATHRPLFGDGILKSSGEAWAYQRRLIAPEFFPDKVRAMVALMVGSAAALVSSWEDRLLAMTSGNGSLELKIDDDIRAYSADVISRTCFGSSYVKGKQIFAVIRELQKTVSKPNLLAEMTGLSFFPTKSSRAAWRLNRQVRGLILDVARGNNSDNLGTSGDDGNLLSAMLRSAAAGGGGVAAEDFIVDNCKNIYFAGYETTAVTAAWCMMLLALHPEWQDAVRDEVRHACPGGAAPPDLASLHKMKKLTMVIQETLRLYPAGSVVSRQALRDVTLGGVRVPAGVSIYVPVSTVHLDPELWGADAAEFDPGRFGRQPPPHAYLPFGAGARTCLGQGFAMAELKVLLALVLARFRLSLSPRYQHAPALRLIVEPEHGVRLLLQSVDEEPTVIGQKKGAHAHQVTTAGSAADAATS